MSFVSISAHFIFVLFCHHAELGISLVSQKARFCAIETKMKNKNVQIRENTTNQYFAIDNHLTV